MTLDQTDLKGIAQAIEVLNDTSARLGEHGVWLPNTLELKDENGDLFAAFVRAEVDEEYQFDTRVPASAKEAE